MRRFSSLALNLGGWTLVALFFATQLYAYELSIGETVRFWDILRSALIEWYIWAALTPFIVRLSRRVPIAAIASLPSSTSPSLPSSTSPSLQGNALPSLPPQEEGQADTGLGRRSLFQSILFHLAASVLFALFHIALHALLHIGSQPMLVAYLWQQPELFPSVFSALTLRLLTDILHLNLMTYWLIVGGEHLAAYSRLSHERELQAAVLQIESASLQMESAAMKASASKFEAHASKVEAHASKVEAHASRLEAQLAKAELGALKMQLQPHFLFNTLNAVATLVHKDADAAELMVTRLSRFLRLTLDAHHDTHPLWQEIEFIDIYLAIEQVRFGSRLKIEFELQPDAPQLVEALVPSLILQPLVENAIRHGISRRTASGQLTVRAMRHGDTLTLAVDDDGAGLRAAPQELREGIGLSNTRARLRQLYGDGGDLTIHSLAPHGTRVTLTFPFQLDGSEPGKTLTAETAAPQRTETVETIETVETRPAQAIRV